VTKITLRLFGAVLIGNQDAEQGVRGNASEFVGVFIIYFWRASTGAFASKQFNFAHSIAARLKLSASIGEMPFFLHQSAMKNHCLISTFSLIEEAEQGGGGQQPPVASFGVFIVIWWEAVPHLGR
jgi:hypothetical protein